MIDRPSWTGAAGRGSGPRTAQKVTAQVRQALKDEFDMLRLDDPKLTKKAFAQRKALELGASASLIRQVLMGHR